MAEWGERSGLTPIKCDFDRGVYGCEEERDWTQKKDKEKSKIERGIEQGRKQIHFNSVSFLIHIPFCC